MMERVKLILSFQGRTMEIVLEEGQTSLLVGTSPEAEARLYPAWFFAPIKLTLEMGPEGWYAACPEHLYLSDGSSRKLLRRQLTHGDTLMLCYQASDTAALSLSFELDFQNEVRKLRRRAELGDLSYLGIGSEAESEIRLLSPHAKEEQVLLKRRAEGWYIARADSRCGILVNGRKQTIGGLIREGDFLWIADYAFCFAGGCVYLESREDLLVKGLTLTENSLREGYPHLKRITRLKTEPDLTPIEILDPPDEDKEREESVLLRLLPAGGLILAAVVMALFGGARMLIFAGISGITALLVAGLSLVKRRKERKRRKEERVRIYTEYIEQKEQQIRQYRYQELQDLEQRYLPLEEVEQRIRSFSPFLFDRSPSDEDFLCVRLGSGDIPSGRPIRYRQQEKLEEPDALSRMPGQLSEQYRFLPLAPVSLDLRDVHAVGVCGPEQERREFLKNMVLDLIGRQHPAELHMAFFGPSHLAAVFRWMPHFFSDPLSLPAAVSTKEGGRLLMDRLYQELLDREAGGAYDDHILIFLYEDTGFWTHPLSGYLGKAKELKVHLIFFKDRPEEIPAGAQRILQLAGDGRGLLFRADRCQEAVSFTYPHIPDGSLKELAYLLSPIKSDEIAPENTLPRDYTLFDMLHIMAAEELDLALRWGKSDVTRSLAAPIGLGASGPVWLDLSEEADGPHGLVAGTTGSGKSELLQTYILAVASRYHPHEVGFVLIDFKGGGMAGQLQGLPHLMGTITNMDGQAISRSLQSIKAELTKRQQLFASAGVNHIDQYIGLCHAGKVTLALPHLIIIVDEFAELKAEHPEFMKELISASRIGRSLGVHLILATQKPAGQVSEQIWSNSRFKLCLRVASREDSKEVLKSPLAAEIKQPGRAYLQVGAGERFELFQSAFSGASTTPAAKEDKPFQILKLSENERWVPIYTQLPPEREGQETQLSALVRHIQNYCRSQHIVKLSEICLPPLPEKIPELRDNNFVKPGKRILQKRLSLPDQEEAGDKKQPMRKLRIPLGLMDLPDRQAQEIYQPDLARQNLLILGSSRSGKTNLLEVILTELTGRYSPEEVRIYLIDCASLALTAWESLPHVGGVVTASEEEKLKSLFRLLREELSERRRKKVRSRIVLLIDGLTALRELYLSEKDELLPICREGLSLGISIVAACQQTAGISYRYLSVFGERIALFCHDESEYSSLLGFCRQRLPYLPGRALVTEDRRIRECQMVLSFGSEEEEERSLRFKEHAGRINERYPGSSVRKIPQIPEELTFSSLQELFSGRPAEPYRVAAGLSYQDAAPWELDLRSLGVLGISGGDTGRDREAYAFVQLLLTAAEARFPGKIGVYLLDGIFRPLKQIAKQPFVRGYTASMEEAGAYVATIHQELQQRYDSLRVADAEAEAPAFDLLVLVAEGPDMAEELWKTPENRAALEAMTGRYRTLGVLLITIAENRSISYQAQGLLRCIRESHQLLFFDQLQKLKLFDPPVAALRSFTKPLHAGDAYYLREGEAIKVKTPRFMPGLPDK